MDRAIERPRKYIQKIKKGFSGNVWLMSMLVEQAFFYAIFLSLGLRLLGPIGNICGYPPPKELCLLHNIYTLAKYVLDCFPLRTVAFRGHGFSLLALAKGMSTLFARNGFSRPSLEQFCGVFRHVLFPHDK